MKMFKVCSDCINELKNLKQRHQSLSVIENGAYVYLCQNKPKCFDQPERSKREDSLSKDFIHNECSCSNESKKTRCSKCCLELTNYLSTDSPDHWKDCCGNIDCATYKEVHSKNKFPFRCEMRCLT